MPGTGMSQSSPTSGGNTLVASSLIGAKAAQMAQVTAQAAASRRPVPSLALHEFLGKAGTSAASVSSSQQGPYTPRGEHDKDASQRPYAQDDRPTQPQSWVRVFCVCVCVCVCIYVWVCVFVCMLCVDI